jgi:hypothetical protein
VGGTTQRRRQDAVDRLVVREQARTPSFRTARLVFQNGPVGHEYELRLGTSGIKPQRPLESLRRMIRRIERSSDRTDAWAWERSDLSFTSNSIPDFSPNSAVQQRRTATDRTKPDLWQPLRAASSRMGPYPPELHIPDDTEEVTGFNPNIAHHESPVSLARCQIFVTSCLSCVHYLQRKWRAQDRHLSTCPVEPRSGADPTLPGSAVDPMVERERRPNT